MERLAAGERDLAGLAADLGFADQAHLTRALRAETGTTPGALRTLLTTSPGTVAPGGHRRRCPPPEPLNAAFNIRD
jgi:AraC-like DNA-binding protein